MFAYVKGKSGLPVVDDKLIVESDTDFKNLLYVMDQRFYTVDIYEVDRIANSVRVVNN